VAALIFIVILLASLAGNGLLWHQVTTEHDARTSAETKLGEANKATQTCNDSVTRLETEARERNDENAKLRQEAQNRRRAQESLAQQILSTPATTPGNDCKSASDRVRNWLKGRKP
jgi:FtsZ-binding cell division protein ZapB